MAVKNHNETQRDFVLSTLLQRGYITRNECLRRNITRLSSIIFNLKEEGLQITAGKVKLPSGRYDFRYELHRS